MIQVGDAMFTLGQATKGNPTNDTVTILAAASGFIVITLQIAYLPALYAAYNRRGRSSRCSPVERASRRGVPRS